MTAEFLSGLGAPSSVAKAGTDFATEMDLTLERRIGGALAQRTGIAVHGEEFGGADLDDGPVWLIDPIDGTVNYSVGLPLTAMLVALCVDGFPVIGLTWLPSQNLRFRRTCRRVTPGRRETGTGVAVGVAARERDRLPVVLAARHGAIPR